MLRLFLHNIPNLIVFIMLISYKYKFIFIHNPKVAGLSIKKALEPFALVSPSKMHGFNSYTENLWLGRQINFYLFNIIPWLDCLPFHGSALDLRRKIGVDIWNEFYTFGFVRNPWDREISIFKYILNKPKHERYQKFNDLGSFDNYVHWLSKQKKRRSQKSMFYDDTGQLIVNKVGRFESLTDDFNFIMDKLKINCNLPHINTSKRKGTYRDNYSEETRKLIGEYCEEDIKTFNYSF